MRKSLPGFALLVLVAVTLSSVPNKASGSDISDEALLAIFGNSTFGSPLRIERKTLECVQLGAGIVDDTFRDMPEELLWAFKTECRRGIKKRLENPDRNPLGLTLRDVETRAVAQRLSAMRKAARDAAQQAYDEKTKSDNEQRRSEWLEKRDQTVKHYNELEATFFSINQLCATWRDYRTASLEKKKRVPWASLEPCSPELQADAAEAAKAFVSELTALNADSESGQFSANKLRPRSHLKQFSPENLSRFERTLRQQIEIMKSRLNG